MMSLKAARRYARALIGLSRESAQLERWGAELERLARAAADPEVATLLASPTLTPQARVQTIDHIAERLAVGFPVRSFVAVVTRHGRVAELEAISQAYQHMLDEHLGRTRATLTFAREPDDAQVKMLVERLAAIAGKTIIPIIKVDAALLGGVTTELEGRIYDGSLSTQLAEAEKRLCG
jgi:F-type H+-transporting ATPase subunit delta